MIVYTSSSNFFYSSRTDESLYEYENEAKYYMEMHDERLKEWVSQRIEDMKNEKSAAEKLFLSKMNGFKWRMETQVYFNIDGKSFFLDFFVPKLMIAFEVDGSKYHSNHDKRYEDLQRDKLFEKIGIRTVRFGYGEIKRADFRDSIFTPRVKSVIEGHYDPVDYYVMPKCVRFDGRMTTNQMLLDAAIKVLSKAPENSQIVIATSFIYLIQMAERDKLNHRGYENIELLDKLYESKMGKMVSFVYIGDRSSIFKNFSQSRLVKYWDKRYKALPDKTPVYIISVDNKRAHTKMVSKKKLVIE